MRKVKIIVVCILAFIILGMAACFFYKPLYYRLYLGDRITGSIKVLVDGVPVKLDETCFTPLADLKITVNEFDTAVSRKGGEYGAYYIDMIIPDVNIPVQICVHHFNWWCVTDFSINAEVSTDGNIVSVSCTSTCVDDKGEDVQSGWNRNYDADTDVIEFSVGDV